MSSKISFFPVGNGDMTLIETRESKWRKILIDMNISFAQQQMILTTKLLMSPRCLENVSNAILRTDYMWMPC